MWSYAEMLSPLLTVLLTIAICVGAVSFAMGQAKPHP